MVSFKALIMPNLAYAARIDFTSVKSGMRQMTRFFRRAASKSTADGGDHFAKTAGPSGADRISRALSALAAEPKVSLMSFSFGITMTERKSCD